LAVRERVVEFHTECEKWADSLDQADAEALLAAIRVLRDQGPALGLADQRFNEHQAVLSAQRNPSPSPRVRKSATKAEGPTMSLKDWERRVLAVEGAAERVAEVEEELRLAAGLTALRERVGLSQAEVAERIGVSQPRVAAIERSANVTLHLLERYVSALLPGGGLDIVAVQGRRRFPLLTSPAVSGAARAAASGVGRVRNAAGVSRRATAVTARKAAVAGKTAATAKKKAS
jgi:DNA-binding XRE family transcriptional regulator